MSDKIIVHVGMGKCGSTTIQVGISKYARLLRQEGFSPYTHHDFPAIRSVAFSYHHRHALPFEIDYFVKRKAQGTEELNPVKIAQEINETLKNANGVPVLSSEFFLDPHVTRCRERLLFLKEIVRNFLDVKIIVYYRAPDKLLRSLYAQWFCPDFPVDFETFCGHFDFECENYEYSLNIKNTVNDIQRILGDVEVAVRFLEQMEGSGGLFRDFLQTVGLERIPDELSVEEKNVTLSPDQFGLLYMFRDDLDKELLKKAEKSLRRKEPFMPGGEHILPDREMRLRVLRYYRDDAFLACQEHGAGCKYFLDDIFVSLKITTNLML